MSRRPVSDEEASAARDVLERHYRQWVDSTALDLARAVLDDEVSDSEAMHDRLHETVDSALTYYSDQHLVVFASNSTQEGEREVEDMGGSEAGRYLGVWAFCTFQIDVRESLERLGLGGDFEREEWVKEVLKGAHGPELAVLADTMLLSGRLTVPMEDEE